MGMILNALIAFTGLVLVCGDNGGYTDVFHHHHHYYAPVHNHNGAPETAKRRMREREEPHHRRAEGRECARSVSDRMWRFQVGDDYGPYEYIDSEGYIKGFHVDLIEAVCRTADRRCRAVMDTYTNCWQTRSKASDIPGVGLLSGWYDGCVGLYVSPERLNSFNFSVAFSNNHQAALYFKGRSGRGDTTDLTNLTIGFIDGWAVGPKCLSRQLYTFEGMDHYTSEMFDAHQDMVVALQLGQIDAFFSTDTFDSRQQKSLGIHMGRHHVTCTTSGPAMMARYGDDVINWWNDAFSALRASGGYQRLCEQSRERHAHRGSLDCLT